MLKPLSMRLQVLGLFALASVAGGLWLARTEVVDTVTKITGGDSRSASGKRRGRRGGGKRAVPVIVAMVSEARSDESIAAVGTARARRSIMLHAKTDGVIMQFVPGAGQRVEAGSKIFELDTTQAKLAVRLSEKRLEDARRLLARQQQLKRRRVTSNAKVDDNRVAVERAELELRQAKEILKDQTIKAPFTGFVGLPTVEVGDRIAATTPVVSLDQRTELLVEFVVPERYATRIAVGQALEAETPGFADQRFSGQIGYVDSRIDPTSRTVKLRAVIPNERDLLRPGMSFVVDLTLPGKVFAAVPELSLQWRKGESFVWIVRGKKVEKVLVRTVQRQNSRVLIDGPIKRGELVVVEGVQRLRNGRSVEFDPPVGSAVVPAAGSSARAASKPKG